jgi:capsular exopolysaccharide synthesis family protein
MDGARQYFTRAYDFGFSKNAEETFRHWPRDSILRDVVTVVRSFKPHVIVAMFSGTPRDGHGHHQASGILAREAYDIAGDTVRLPRAPIGMETSQLGSCMLSGMPRVRQVTCLSTSFPFKLILMFGGLTGFLGGLGIAFARNTLDRSVRSTRQVRDDLGLECLGELPRIKNSRGALGCLVQAYKMPFSAFSERLRSVKIAIGLANPAEAIRCIGITSASSGEGKSTLASNLAIVWSLSGSRTLLIDADVLSSALTRNFAPEAKAGIIESLVAQGAAAREQIVTIAYGHFDLLPIVPERTLNSGDVLGSPKMRQLLKDLSLVYETIIVDLPPLTAMVDGLAVSPLLDGVIVVAEWGETPLELLSDALCSLQAAKASVIGVVLTKVGARSKARYRASRQIALRNRLPFRMAAPTSTLAGAQRKRHGFSPASAANR